MKVFMVLVPKSTLSKFPASNRKINGYSIVFTAGNFGSESLLVCNKTNRGFLVLYILMFLWPRCSTMPWYISIKFDESCTYSFLPIEQGLLLLLPCFCVHFPKGFHQKLWPFPILGQFQILIFLHQTLPNILFPHLG